MSPLFDEELVRHLRKLADGSIKPEKKHYGLCAEIERLAPSSTENINSLTPIFRTWKHFSGDRLYPVQDPEMYGSAKHQYNRALDLWRGRHGELRRDLCTHVANEIEKKL